MTFWSENSYIGLGQEMTQKKEMPVPVVGLGLVRYLGGSADNVSQLQGKWNGPSDAFDAVDVGSL